jgi:hypothetical protein
VEAEASADTVVEVQEAAAALADLVAEVLAVVVLVVLGNI